MTPFLKMHGLGNDFVIFDGREQAISIAPARARALADRKRGIGCDQLILITKDMTGAADAFMRIHNADGSEVEACGNATRCVGRLLLDETGKPSVTIRTVAGVLTCTDAASTSSAKAVTVDMGAPELDWNRVPLADAVDTNHFTVEADGEALTAAAVSMGNPHCVLFVADADQAPVASLGPKLEIHPLFPNRTNVEFVSVRDRQHLRMRVWERGAGITQACGTGACASAVAAIRRGLTDSTVEVELDGGVLTIAWTDGHVLMTGDTALAFAGTVDLSA